MHNSTASEGGTEKEAELLQVVRVYQEKGTAVVGNETHSFQVEVKLSEVSLGDLLYVTSDGQVSSSKVKQPPCYVLTACGTVLYFRGHEQPQSMGERGLPKQSDDAQPGKEKWSDKTEALGVGDEGRTEDPIPRDQQEKEGTPKNAETQVLLSRNINTTEFLHEVKLPLASFLNGKTTDLKVTYNNISCWATFELRWVAQMTVAALKEMYAIKPKLWNRRWRYKLTHEKVTELQTRAVKEERTRKGKIVEITRWSLPKGEFHNSSESQAECAARETEEEAKVVLDAATLSSCSSYFLFDKDEIEKELYYLHKMDSQPTVSYGVETTRWVSLLNLQDYVNDRALPQTLIDKVIEEINKLT